MKTIIVGCNKGGASKTTTATCLSVALAQAGSSVFLLDADDQLSASKWSKKREALGDDSLAQVTVAYRDGNLSPFIRSLEGKYDFCVVDVKGAVTRELSTAMAIADILVAPYKCSGYDTDTISALYDQVDIAVNTIGNDKLKTLIYQTMATTNHVIRHKERQNFVVSTSGFEGLELMKSISSHRQAYIDTSYSGLGVTEMQNRMAKAEMRDFVKEVLSHV
jgi:chromosome partitioning protein